MALDTTKLQQASVGNSPSPTIWTYITATDAAGDVDASDYWGTAPAAMKVGDVIKCYCSDGFVELGVTAISQAAATSTVSAIGSGGSSGAVWIGPVRCTVLETAGTAGNFVAPITGNIDKWYTVTTEVIDTTDAILNLDKGGTNMTGSITIAVAGTAVGVVDTATVSANNAVTAGDAIKIETDGGPASTGECDAYIRITP